MTLHAVVDSLDGINEAFHSEYKEQDGKYILDLADDIKVHPRVGALTIAFDRAKKERKVAQDEVATLKERFSGLPDDFDPAEFGRLRELADKGGKPDEQLVKLRDSLEKKHTTERKSLEDRIKKLSGFVSKSTIDDTLTRSLVDAGVAKEFLPAARALLKDKGVIKLVEDEKSFEAMVDTDMGPATLSKYVSEWATQDEGRVFVARPSGGDATGGGNRPVSGTNPWSKEQHNLTSQELMIRDNPVKARQFALAAGKTPDW